MTNIFRSCFSSTPGGFGNWQMDKNNLKEFIKMLAQLNQSGLSPENIKLVLQAADFDTRVIDAAVDDIIKTRALQRVKRGNPATGLS